MNFRNSNLTSILSAFHVLRYLMSLCSVWLTNKICILELIKKTCLTKNVGVSNLRHIFVIIFIRYAQSKKDRKVLGTGTGTGTGIPKSLNKTTWVKQTIQWPKRNGRNDKQWSKKHYTKTLRLSNTNLIKNREWIQVPRTGQQFMFHMCPPSCYYIFIFESRCF